MQNTQKIQTLHSKLWHLIYDSYLRLNDESMQNIL